MRYENEICPVCEHSFLDGDDIVVCPDCGTPHHRACWQEENKCHFEHLHETDYVWNASQSDSNEQKNTDNNSERKICSNCGESNDPNAKICANCNIPFIILEALDAETVGDTMVDGEFVSGEEFVDREHTLTVGEASIYIGQNKEKFIKSFLKAKFTKGRQKFNWAAFFLSPMWFFYRKIYSAGAAFSGAILGIMLLLLTAVSRSFHDAIEYIVALVEDGVVEMSREMWKRYIELIEKGARENPEFLEWTSLILLLFVITNLIAGFFANRIYLEKIKRDTRKIKQLSPNPLAYKRYLFARGGASVPGAIFCVIILKFVWELIVSLVDNFI